MSPDRRVHARGSTAPALPNGGQEVVEVVRYDRAGTWYVEGPCTGRRRLALAAAVDIAETIARHGGELFFGLSGGSVFDRRLADYREDQP